MLFVAIIVAVSVVLTRKSEKKMEPKGGSSNPLLAYFGISDGINMKWAHAVNSKAKLSKSLFDTAIMFLEADVLMDPIAGVPIMAHPPDNTSDINLRQWLQEVFSFHPVKGIKLDFKQLQAVKPSLEILKDFVKNQTKSNKSSPPILLNADIISGPNNPHKVPVNATEFLQLSRTYCPDGVLSPGWTTSFPSNASEREGYSWAMITNMTQVLDDLKIEQPVTFPVRTSLVAKSKEQIIWLLERKRTYSLTLWHSSVDVYDIKSVQFLRKYPDKVYYDIPDNILDELKKLNN